MTANGLSPGGRVAKDRVAVDETTFDAASGRQKRRILDDTVEDIMV